MPYDADKKRAYYQKNKASILKKRKDHYEKNHDEVRERQDLYRLGPKYAALKGRYNAYQRKYRKKKYATDPQWKLMVNCRGRIHNALKKGNKDDATVELLGCTPTQLYEHLGDGEGELDHIWPLCMYDLTDKAQQLMAFNFRNMQLVSKEYNRAKYTNEPSDAEKAKVPMELWPPGRRPQSSSPGPSLLALSSSPVCA
tara:strand:- start:200 stop:793 length:594 start_codon:yes stop_codon:yes gene_type:complete